MNSSFARSARLRAPVVAALTLGLSASAYATGGGEGSITDHESITVTGSIPATCAFTTLPNMTDLGVLTTGLEKNTGILAFTCNLASGNASLTVKSANGALRRDGGTETIAYEVSWQINGNMAFTNAATWLSLTPFSLPAGPSGVPQPGAYKVKVTGSTVGLTAGAYKDTITYTIAP